MEYNSQKIIEIWVVHVHFTKVYLHTSCHNDEIQIITIFALKCQIEPGKVQEKPVWLISDATFDHTPSYKTLLYSLGQTFLRSEFLTVTRPGL